MLLAVSDAQAPDGHADSFLCAHRFCRPGGLQEVNEMLSNGAFCLRTRARRPTRGLVAVLVLVSLLGGALPPAAAARSIAAPAAVVHSGPMATWSDFQPEGWITAVPFTASVSVSEPTGLDPASAEYQTSADGGAGWSEWGATNLTAGGTVSSTQSITVTDLLLADAADNQIAFRIQDSNGVTLTSPAYTLAVDSTPPDNPANWGSSSHTVGVWSNDPTVDVNWDAGNDATSGVDGYALLWDQAPLTVPVPPTTTAALNETSLPLPDGSDHYVHLRTADRAGLWSADALHLGPFFIDTEAPTSSITFPVEGTTYADVPAITGTAAEPGSSGVALVEVRLQETATGNTWDGTAWVATEQWLAATGTAAWNLSNDLPLWGDGQSYTVHSRASDVAGNVEAVSVGVTFTVDSGGPGPPVDLTATPADWSSVDSFDVQWSNPSDPAGIGGAWYKLDAPPAGDADGTFVAGVDLTSLSGLTVGADGAHDLYVWLQDGLGNADHTQTAVVTLYLDSTPPGPPQGLVADPAGWTNVDSFTANWTNPAELAGVAGGWYKLDAPPAHAADGTYVPGPDLQSISDLSVGSDGEHDLYVWLEDVLGQADHTQRAEVEMRLDTAAPGAPTNLDADPDGWQMVNDFSIGWRNPPDTSGIAGAYWKLNEEPVAADDGTFVAGADLALITDLTVPVDGQHDLYLWLADEAGNADHHNRNVLIRAFSFDGAPPLTDLALDGPQGLGGWYTGAVAGTLSAEDAASGVAGTHYRIDGGAWVDDTEFDLLADGVYLVEYQSWDEAGNEEPLQAVDLLLDGLAPVTAHALSAPAGPGGWYSGTVTVTLTISDDVSGPAAIAYRVDGGEWLSEPPDAFDVVFVHDGQHVLEYYGQDVAGNVEAQHELLVPIDMQPPSTAYLLSGDEGLDGWFTSSVAVTLLPEDTVSGIAATYYRLDGGAWQSGTEFVIADQGTHVLEFYSVDGLGNEEQWFPVPLKIDTQAPGPPTRPQASPPGWTNVNDFEIVWANPQDLSGIGGACYKLGEEPDSPDDGFCSAVTSSRLHDIRVPDEGAYDLFLWLRDGAGNADHNNRNVALNALLYDTTPPTTTMVVSGSVGWNGWYTAPLTIVFDVEDTLSGPGDARYRIDGGPWQEGLQAPLAGEDKHVLEYYGLDVAGNEEALQTATLRMDLSAPNPPTSLVVSPQGWSTENRFRASWNNPLDFSGIAGAFYRFDAPPAHAYDGTLVTTTTTITNMVVPSEGRHDLYLWLVDTAGNADPAHWLMAPDVVWYDGTPPTTTLVVSGTAASGGWYKSDLDVTVAVDETASGVAEVRVQIDDGDWIEDTAFGVTTEGPHAVKHYGMDVAGNVEATRTTWLNIDREPPQSTISGLATYQSSSVFTVSWQGSDGRLGSGVAGYDLQVRQGHDGPWLTWMVNTPLTSALFAGQPGRTYYFRVRARDVAGHIETYLGGDGNARTAVQVVPNYDFEEQTFDPWELYGALSDKSEVAETLSPRGESTWAARLGSPDYGASTDLAVPGTVPTGAANISQSIVVPGSSDMVAPTLTLWYRILTYDVLWSEWNQKIYDTFEVTLQPSGGGTPVLVLQDGNDVGPNPQLGVDYGVLKDLGWRYARIDLTDYAGQTVEIVFANHNRWDGHFNTWTFVDDVQIVDRHGHVTRFLPLLSTEGEVQAAAAVPHGQVLDGPRAR
jgi:hypothetical protein